MAELETIPLPWKPAVQAAKHGLSQTRPMMHVIVIDPHPGATRNKEELNFSLVAMPLAATDRFATCI
jgi:hypothetical protein